MIGALCDGIVEVSGLGTGHDNRATERILGQLGVQIERSGTRARVHGVGLNGLRAPLSALDCGNSGTTMRLMDARVEISTQRAVSGLALPSSRPGISRN